MIFICGKEYESYDEAAHDLLGVSKNSLYRFLEREKLPRMSIVEIIEYCVKNDISREQILPKRIRHFTKSFEEVMIDKYGIDNIRRYLFQKKIV